MNNIGLIKHGDEILCTGFIIRVAISTRDITLITSSSKITDNLVFELNGQSYDIKLQYQHSSGLSLFIPLEKINNLTRDNIKFEFPPRQNHQSTEYFLHNAHECCQFTDFNKIYHNQEGSVVINEYWEVFAVIVDQKCLIKDQLQVILKEALDIFFAVKK